MNYDPVYGVLITDKYSQFSWLWRYQPMGIAHVTRQVNIDPFALYWTT